MTTTRTTAPNAATPRSASNAGSARTASGCARRHRMLASIAAVTLYAVAVSGATARDDVTPVPAPSDEVDSPGIRANALDASGVDPSAVDASGVDGRDYPPEHGAQQAALAPFHASYDVRVFIFRGSVEVQQTLETTPAGTAVPAEAATATDQAAQTPTAARFTPTPGPILAAGFAGPARAASTAEAPPGAAAVRAVTAPGEVGTAADTPSPRWRFRSVSQAKGVAKLFVRGELIEDARFALHPDGRLRPLTVSVEDQISDKPREVVFDWSDADAGIEADAKADAEAGDGLTATARGTDRGESFELEVAPEVLDRALLVPAIGLELAQSAGKLNEHGMPELKSFPYDPERGYRARVLEKGEVQDYFARPLGEEEVEGPDGTPVDTLVLEHQRDGSSRATRFWLAPSLGYLPVRIEQRKDGRDKPHFRATLAAYQRL